MTIFDICPYSFWRDLHRTAHHAWAHLGKDTPRSVCELTLLREVNRRLLIDNRRLATDLAETAARLSAEQRYQRREVRRQNERLTAATGLVEQGSLLLRAMIEENRWLAAQLARIDEKAAIWGKTPLASINTPASGKTCEIGGVACATVNGGNNV